MTRIIESGKCRVCGCTELSPCLSGGEDGNPMEKCAWIDRAETLCSSLGCIAVMPLADLLEMIGLADAA